MRFAIVATNARKALIYRSPSGSYFFFFGPVFVTFVGLRGAVFADAVGAAAAEADDAGTVSDAAGPVGRDALAGGAGVEVSISNTGSLGVEALTRGSVSGPDLPIKTTKLASRPNMNMAAAPRIMRLEPDLFWRVIVELRSDAVEPDALCSAFESAGAAGPAEEAEMGGTLGK